MENLGCSFIPLMVTGSLLSVTVKNTATTNNLEKKWFIWLTVPSQSLTDVLKGEQGQEPQGKTA